MNSLTVEEEAIQTILSRAEKGRNEYGEGLHEAEKPIEEWMTFIIEEMLDSALYLMKARRKLNSLIAAHVADTTEVTTEVATEVAGPRVPQVGEIWVNPSGTCTVKSLSTDGAVGYVFIEKDTRFPMPQHGEIDMATFVKWYSPPTEPEIKMPLVGEIWTSLSGLSHATIRPGARPGTVGFSMSQPYTGERAMADVVMPLVDFLKSYTFGRS